MLFNERVLKVDDPCGAVAVHGYCGWFGALAVGIFADGTYGAGWNGVGASTYLGVPGQGVTGLLHGDTTQFLMQLGRRDDLRRLGVRRHVHRVQARQRRLSTACE